MNTAVRWLVGFMVFSTLPAWSQPLLAKESTSQTPQQTYQVSSSSATPIAVNNALKALKSIVKTGRRFNNYDCLWLTPLQRLIGSESLIIADPDHPQKLQVIDNRLTVQNLNKIPGSAQQLLYTLETLQYANEDNYLTFTGCEDNPLKVYNREIYPLLSPHYTSDSFTALFQAAQDHQVFKIYHHPSNGLAYTTGMPAGQNKEMSERQWITDTVRAGEIDRAAAPQHWRRALNTIATFYTSPIEQAAFDRAIAHPETYLEGGPEEGVAHIFYPNTLKRDPNWFNNKRLESHGLALIALCQAIKDGCLTDDPAGIAKPSQAMCQAIANLTAYFIAINYYQAPSAGNWEELPFPGGLTWDTEAIRAALANLDDLLYNPDYNDNLAVGKVRQALRNCRHSKYMSNRTLLTEAIRLGQNRLEQTYRAESPGHREIDSSLAFLASSTLRLDNDPLVSAEKFLGMLEMLEANLAREQGMIRYMPFTMMVDGREISSPDSYLTLNYNIACDSQGHLSLAWKKVLNDFGSKDASDPAIFAARASLAKANCEAEWFMVSDLARGYAQQAMRIISAAQKRSPKGNRITLTPQENQQVARAMQGATRSINRAYARLTPEHPNALKANGRPCPAWSVPEAWQAVSIMSSQKGEHTYVPGLNTPLTWAQASLWVASQDFSRALRMQELCQPAQP